MKALLTRLPRGAALAAFALMSIVVLGCGTAHETAAAPELWYCPMHPDVTSDGPGECPICHMDLVKAEPGAGPGATGLEGGGVDPHRAGVPLGVTATVEAAFERTPRRVRTVGRVLADERRIARVESRVAGWVVDLAADFTGRRVSRGERLATIDSPELYAAEREYLAAREAARELRGAELAEVRRSGDDLVFAARRRLELLDLPADFLPELDRTGKPSRTVGVFAPAGGFVEEKGVVLGQKVEPGMALFTIRDLSRIWIEADLYEADAAFARLGQRATIGSPFDPALRLEAAASYVYPELDPKARTLRVRFDAANPQEALRPGMFVDVDVELGELSGVVVPDAAVVTTGERTLVFVATGEELEPREVRLAGRQQGRAWIADGLVAGERVAAEPAFLLDSESRLREAARGHATNGATAEPAEPTEHSHR